MDTLSPRNKGSVEAAIGVPTLPSHPPPGDFPECFADMDATLPASRFPLCPLSHSFFLSQRGIRERE